MTKLHDDLLKSLITFYSEMCASPFVEEEFTEQHMMTIDALNELIERREKDCDHEIIPMKNEVIDSGYMCIHCGLVLKQASPETAKEKLNAAETSSQ